MSWYQGMSSLWHVAREAFDMRHVKGRQNTIFLLDMAFKMTLSFMIIMTPTWTPRRICKTPKWILSSCKVDSKTLVRIWFTNRCTGSDLINFCKAYKQPDQSVTSKTSCKAITIITLAYTTLDSSHSYHFDVNTCSEKRIRSTNMRHKNWAHGGDGALAKARADARHRVTTRRRILIIWFSSCGSRAQGGEVNKRMQLPSQLAFCASCGCRNLQKILGKISDLRQPQLGKNLKIFGLRRMLCTGPCWLTCRGVYVQAVKTWAFQISIHFYSAITEGLIFQNLRLLKRFSEYLVHLPSVFV